MCWGLRGLEAEVALNLSWNQEIGLAMAGGGVQKHHVIQRIDCLNATHFRREYEISDALQVEEQMESLSKQC